MRPPRSRRATRSSSHLQAWRQALVVLLTFLTGSADAIGFFSLGGAFSSVMTGNMVLLGLSAGSGDAALALTSGSAIASFIVGVLAGAHVAGSPRPGDPVWPPRVTLALAVELVVMVVFSALWLVSLPGRSDEMKLALLMLAAVALGVQSSAVQRFGVSGLSSTYLTGTLTSLIAGLASRSPWHTLRPRIQILLALIGGAAVGAVTAEHLPAVAPVLVVVPLLSVIGTGWWLARRSRRLSPPRDEQKEVVTV